MFNKYFSLLQDILEQQRTTNKLLASLGGINLDDADSLSTKKPDFSSAKVYGPPSEEELLEEENDELRDKIRDRFGEVDRTGSKQFFEEDEIGDIREEINEA